MEAENILTGETRHTSTAYLYFVALDGNGSPMPFPELIRETDDEQRRNGEGNVRRKNRLAEKGKEN